jgi:hypothetical protein
MSTTANNLREQARQDKQREKAARRGQRHEDKAAHPRQKTGEDLDLAGMKPGPQATLLPAPSSTMPHKPTKLVTLSTR